MGMAGPMLILIVILIFEPFLVHWLKSKLQNKVDQVKMMVLTKTTSVSHYNVQMKIWKNCLLWGVEWGIACQNWLHLVLEIHFS